MDRTSALLRFAAGMVGQRVTAPGGLGGQCVDLVELWMLVLGAARTWGNAVNLLQVASPAEWDIVENAPTNYPPAGAIVVWGAYAPHGIGPYGHTAIAIAADESSLLVLEQNWPTGAPVRWGQHADYGGVKGWMLREL